MRVLDKWTSIVGWALADERHVMTCSHAVNLSLGKVEEPSPVPDGRPMQKLRVGRAGLGDYDEATKEIMLNLHRREGIRRQSYESGARVG